VKINKAKGMDLCTLSRFTVSPQYQQIKREIDVAASHVIESAQFVLDPDVGRIRGTVRCILQREALHRSQQRYIGTSLGASSSRHSPRGAPDDPGRQFGTQRR
jgi:hypothetical protein